MYCYIPVVGILCSMLLSVVV